MGFVPYRLEIAGRPELNNFPLNVLFADFTLQNGERLFGSALYEPDLESFKKDGNEFTMKYRNKYGGDCWLCIAYDELKKSYRGEKFVNGKSTGSAYGIKWQGFFAHFTILGLAAGERCEFIKFN